MKLYSSRSNKKYKKKTDTFYTLSDVHVFHNIFKSFTRFCKLDYDIYILFRTLKYIYVYKNTHKRLIMTCGESLKKKKKCALRPFEQIG